MPLTLLDHMGKYSTGDVDQARQIYGNLGLDIAFGIEILKPIHASQAGIIEKNVDLIIKIKHALDHQFDLGKTCYINRKGQRLVSLLLDFIRQFLKAI